MHVTYPSCNESFPIVAGFLEPGGKRFGLITREQAQQREADARSKYGMGNG